MRDRLHRLRGEPDPLGVTRARIRVVVGGLGLLYAAVLVRAAHLQIVDHPSLAEKARRQHDRVVSVAPRRGPVVDRNGRALTLSLAASSIYLDPRELPSAGPERDARLARLAKALGRPEAWIVERAALDLPFVWLVRGATPDVVAAVRALDVPGVGQLPESRRAYPLGRLAAHVLGFVGDDGVGLAGIEQSLERELHGRETTLAFTRDARGRALLGGGGLDGALEDGARDRAERSGATVVLALDATLQAIAEDELERARVEHRATSASAVVMDPATGDVLALASAPTFDPADFRAASAAARRNTAIATTFEPGSTLKAVLAAAALEEREVHERAELDLHGGAWVLAGHTIHDAHPHEHLTFAEVIRHSSNIGAAQIALRLGAARYETALRGFGFGARTGSGLPGEAAGLLRDASRWGPVDLATHGFGQGIGVTSLQLASAFATLANGGVRMQPRLVLEVRPSDGRPVQHVAPVEVARPVTPETAARVTRLLGQVVEPGGTGAAAALDGYRVVGKTGTAQQRAADARGYDPERRVASFAGYVATDHAALAIVVVVDGPQGATSGGRVAAPAFREIARRSLLARGVPPVAPPETTDEPAATPATTPVSGTVAATEPMVVDDDADPTRVPDLRGLTIRQAAALAGARRMTLAPEGRGVCFAQQPPPGTPVGDGLRVRARFAPPADALRARAATASAPGVSLSARTG